MEERGTAIDIQEMLKSGVIISDIFNLYSILDGSGNIVLSSQNFQPGNYSDREHFWVHQQRDTGKLFISKPVLGRVSGKWSIQMTRRINAPDGGFRGVVVVSMDPFYFTRLYHQIDLGKNGLVALVGEDGVVRARHVGESNQVGQYVGYGEVMQAARQRRFGVVHAVSSIDGRERIYGFRRLEHYPLYVVVAMDIEDILEPYKASKVQTLQLAAWSTTAILLFTILILVLIHRLVRSRELALAASEAKTQFLANMSHELRTPLNGILGYAELLKEDLPPGDLRSSAEFIHGSGTHLLALVNSLLQLEKIEAGGVDLNLADENIRSLLQDAVNAHAGSAAVKGLALTLDVAPEVPETVACDRMKIMQVLNNLIHNAIKFTQTGHVAVEAELRDGQIFIAVADTGPGIPDELQSQIFEKFYQVDSSNSRSGEGTGLGLAIVRELVRLMGGSLSLGSAPGYGSRFQFTIPVAAKGAQYPEDEVQDREEV